MLSRSRTESETLEKSRKHAPIERSFERTSSRRYARRTIGGSSTHYIQSERSTNATGATTSAVSSAARSGISSSVTSPALSSAASGAPVSAPLAKVLMAVGSGGNSGGAFQRHGSHTGSVASSMPSSSAPTAVAGRSPSYQSTAGSQLSASATFTSPQQSVRSNGSATTGTSNNNSILSAAVTHMIGELEKEHTQTRALLSRATAGSPPVAPPPPASTGPKRAVSPPSSQPQAHPLNQMAPRSPPTTLNSQPQQQPQQQQPQQQQQQQQQQLQNNRISGVPAVSSLPSAAAQPRTNAGYARTTNYAPPLASGEGETLDGNYMNVQMGKKAAPSPLPIVPPKVPAELTNAQRSPTSAHRNSQLVSLSSSIAPPRTQPQLASAPPPPDSLFARRPASMRAGASSGGGSFDSASPSTFANGVPQPARNASNNARFAS